MPARQIFKTKNDNPMYQQSKILRNLDNLFPLHLFDNKS